MTSTQWMAAVVLTTIAIMASPCWSETSAPLRVPVAAIYFPGFHRDMHYDAWFGEGWNEYKLLAEAPLRFPGHRLLQPDWGPFDEADPAWMARQINLAAEHKIDVFIFDWYWYSGVKILHRPLEEGFLKADNRHEIKYALMWANHDWRNYFPAPVDKESTTLLPIRHSPEDFERVMDHCIATHFRQANYWRVDGAVYFSLFLPDGFMNQLGGPAKTKEVLDRARTQVAQAGLGRLHVAGFLCVPEQIPNMREAGFDSVTTYNITQSPKAKEPDHWLDEYADVVDHHESFWKKMDTGILPYAPVVTVGWDPTPRWTKETPFPPPHKSYPYGTVVVGNTPDKLGELCRRAKRHVQSSRLRPPAILVNAWNEWTEGSALLPDKHYKTAYLDELSKAFE